MILVWLFLLLLCYFLNPCFQSTPLNPFLLSYCPLLPIVFGPIQFSSIFINFLILFFTVYSFICFPSRCLLLKTNFSLARCGLVCSKKPPIFLNHAVAPLRRKTFASKFTCLSSKKNCTLTIGLAFGSNFLSKACSSLNIQRLLPTMTLSFEIKTLIPSFN